VGTTKRDIPIIPTIFPGSVGLSNPLSDNKSLQQIEIKRKNANDNLTKRSARPHAAIIESTIIQTSSTDPGVTKTTTTTTEIVRHASLA
jgi:hypothetical protein